MCGHIHRRKLWDLPIARNFPCVIALVITTNIAGQTQTGLDPAQNRASYDTSFEDCALNIPMDANEYVITVNGVQPNYAGGYNVDCDDEIVLYAVATDTFIFAHWRYRCGTPMCPPVERWVEDNPWRFTASSLQMSEVLISAVFAPRPISIVRQPAGAALYEGFPYRFTVLAEDGVGTFSYSWWKDGVGIGGDSPYLDLGSATGLDAGEYWCRINDGYTTAETVHVALAVYPRAPSGHHAADTNRDWQISLHELLRLVQFHNTGTFHCQEATEDGYAPGTGDIACSAHNADYDAQDWQIGMNELLRVVQFFNAPGGAYHAQSGTEDGYAPQAG